MPLFLLRSQSMASRQVCKKRILALPPMTCEAMRMTAGTAMQATCCSKVSWSARPRCWSRGRQVCRQERWRLL